MAVAANLLSSTAIPTLYQASVVWPTPNIQALPVIEPLIESPDLAPAQPTNFAISPTYQPLTDPPFTPDPVPPELPTQDISMGQLDPSSAADLDPTTLDPPTLDPPFESPLDPYPTEPEPFWADFSSWFEPEIWLPQPIYLMSAPQGGFPILSSAPADSPEDPSGTLPTAMPAPQPDSPSPEVIEAGRAIDRAYDWAFLDSGDVAINGEMLGPGGGGLYKWISGGTTYAGLFNDGLLIGPYLVPYPEEYKRWMREHDIVIWE